MSVSAVLSVIASQYDAIDNRDEFINLAVIQVNRCWFGDKADLATAYMTAHLITLNAPELITGVPNRPNGQAGGVTSLKEGDAAITFGAGYASDLDADLQQTHYGRQFLRLQKSGGAILGVTGGGLDGLEC